MTRRLLQMFLFIVASMTIIIILVSPISIFSGKDAKAVRKTVALQTIAPQRLFISAWRNIKTLYADPTMNNQDWRKWKYRYLKHIKTNEDVAVAINTMLASLNDEYSQFYDKKKYILQEKYIKDNSDKNYSKLVLKILNIKSSAKISLTTTAGMVQSAVVTENSKDFSEPKENDKIISINNYQLKGMEMNSAISLIRGKSNISKVTVLRNNVLKTLSLVQGSMMVEKISSKLLDDNIAYISIYSLMGENALRDFVRAIKKYPDAKGYIIDLRGDVGGLFLNAVYIADEIIEDGQIVTIEYRDGRQYTMNAELPADEYTKPIVVLVNNKTASSSEILAGALQSNKKALLVGEETYGKNAIQQIIPLPNNTCINLTTAYYKFKNGKDFKQGKLIPDYVVKMSKKDILTGNDKQLKKAIAVINSLTK